MAHPQLPPQAEAQADGHPVPPSTVVAPRGDDEAVIIVHPDERDLVDLRRLGQLDARDWADVVNPIDLQ